MTFDTLAVANELKQAGFSQEQAEALAHAWGHVASGDLATKSDLIEVKAELKAEIAGVKSDLIRTESSLKEEIATLRSNLKEEIAILRSSLKEEIATVKSDIEKQIARLEGKFNLLSWMVGFVLAISLIIIGKLLILHP